jgi:hypothetical protein
MLLLLRIPRLFPTKRSLAICYLLVCLALTGCDAHTKVQGYVYTKDGARIERAFVTLQGGGREVGDHTNKEGFYDVGFVHGPFVTPRTTLTVTKDGFQPYQKSFSSPPEENYTVVLEKAVAK